MTDIFAKHYADISAAGGRDDLIGRLKDQGLATFSGAADRASLLDLAHSLLALYLHRDSDPDGVTVITGGAEDHQPGFAGFSSVGLHPHTERSGVAEPPQLLMLCCITAAASGGASQLVDGARLYQEVALTDPALLQILTAPRSVFFGGAAGYLGSVFEDAGTGRMTIRFRLDELAQFSPEVTHALPLLTSLIREHADTADLGRGEGLILDNTRWLHGRSPYTGSRIMLRILGNPLPNFALQRGFATTAARSDEHVHAQARPAQFRDCRPPSSSQRAARAFEPRAEQVAAARRFVGEHVSGHPDEAAQVTPAEPGTDMKQTVHGLAWSPGGDGQANDH